MESILSQTRRSIAAGGEYVTPRAAMHGRLRQRSMFILIGLCVANQDFSRLPPGGVPSLSWLASCQSQRPPLWTHHRYRRCAEHGISASGMSRIGRLARSSRHARGLLVLGQSFPIGCPPARLDWSRLVVSCSTAQELAPIIGPGLPPHRIASHRQTARKGSASVHPIVSSSLGLSPCNLC